jgi:hypothetical protein
MKFPLKARDVDEATAVKFFAALRELLCDDTFEIEPEVLDEIGRQYLLKECGLSNERNLFVELYGQLVEQVNEYQDCDEHDPIDLYCDFCAGSGEGMHDGTRCGSCNGKGIIGQVCAICDEHI